MKTEDHNRLYDILAAAAPTFPSPAACRALGDQLLAEWRATRDATYLFGAEGCELMGELLPMFEAGEDYDPLVAHVHRLLVLAR